MPEMLVIISYLDYAFEGLLLVEIQKYPNELKEWSNTSKTLLG